jgi:hypothetical protein
MGDKLYGEFMHGGNIHQAMFATGPSATADVDRPPGVALVFSVLFRDEDSHPPMIYVVHTHLDDWCSHAGDMTTPTRTTHHDWRLHGHAHYGRHPWERNP